MIALAKPDNIIPMPMKQYLNIVPNANRSNEWFTPYRYVEAARKVLGRIDLDPASCDEANKVIKAERYFTKEDDGLSKGWTGHIFLNPPYGTTNGKSNIGLFTRKLVQEFSNGNVKAAIVVTTTKTDT